VFYLTRFTNGFKKRGKRIASRGSLFFGEEMSDKEPKIRINYIYFGFILIFLIILTTIKVYLIRGHEDSRVFFLFYSLAECVIEVGVLIFIGWLIKHKFSRKAYFAFIGFSFLLILTHPIDFVVNRILDLSFWDTMDFVLDENYNNFLEMLYASGLPLIAWIGIFAAMGLVPFLGIFIYKLTERFANRRPLGIRETHFVQGLFCIPIAMVLWDFSASKVIHPDAYHAYAQALPWKFTFLQPKHIYINNPRAPNDPPDETQILKDLSQVKPTPMARPNVYIFVIESLREDFITPEVTPNICKFRNENIAFDHAFSNANCTPYAWFSIFYSRFPHYWAHVRNSNWETGSIPMKLMKKMGYQINVYSSAMLGYYNMDQIIFGKEHYLADRFNTFPHYYPTEACATDAKTVREIKKAFDQNEVQDHSNLFIVFWDATHFDYSWPKKRPLKFFPICDEIGYFKINPCKESIEKIKNRYRNAVHFVDALFGYFINMLKEKDLYDDAIIVILGDHGEEFYEQGNIFHCSHLSHEQTHIPLYFKFGKNERNIPSKELCSQMEIFPSIFDYILGGNYPKDFFEGSSIFDPEKWPFVFTARYNASRHPYEFFLHNGKRKVTARFTNRNDIFSSKQIQIVSIRDYPDLPISEPYMERRSVIDQQFGSALQRIFSKEDPLSP